MQDLKIKAVAMLLAAGLGFGIAISSAAAQDAGRSGALQATPERIAAARDLIKVTNTEAQLTSLIPILLGQLRQTMPSSDPKVQSVLNEVFAEGEKQFYSRLNEVVDQIVVLYAQKFTSEEMKALADFYRSPTGQKFITAMPELTAESMKIGGAWGRRIAADVERKVREEMRKRGLNP